MNRLYRAWGDTERVTRTLDQLYRAEDEVCVNIRRWHSRCIIANGCFDGCHPGHLSILAHLDRIAYEKGWRPIVAINSDRSVRELKGERRPFMPELARAALINNLKWPFTVIIFDETTPQRLMDLMWPAAVLKGAEYSDQDVIRHRGPDPSIVITVPMIEGYSTTRLLGDTR